MIRNFKHKGLERLYRSGDTRGIISGHAKRVIVRLDWLDRVKTPQELPPQWKCHPLYKELEGYHAIWVNAQWRIVFRFEEDRFCDVDYAQYHG